MEFPLQPVATGSDIPLSLQLATTPGIQVVNHSVCRVQNGWHPTGSIKVTDIVIIQLEQRDRDDWHFVKNKFQWLLCDGWAEGINRPFPIHSMQSTAAQEKSNSFPSSPTNNLLFSFQQLQIFKWHLTLLPTNHWQSRLLCLAEVTGEDGDLNAVASRPFEQWRLLGANFERLLYS